MPNLSPISSRGHSGLLTIEHRALGAEKLKIRPPSMKLKRVSVSRIHCKSLLQGWREEPPNVLADPTSRTEWPLRTAHLLVDWNTCRLESRASRGRKVGGTPRTIGKGY